MTGVTEDSNVSRAQPPLVPGSRRAWGAVALVALGVLISALHVASVYTESVNWDEFALLDRVARSVETGTLHGGGRSGLAVLLLTPIVRDCASAIETVREARLVWAGMTFVYLAGVFALLCAFLRGRPHAWIYAALGVGLLALVPVFLRWSIQVRTDQLALAAGVWGCVALLASRRRARWALAAGLLFGIGYLATRKVIYVVSLGLLLASADLVLARGFRLRRELMRVASAAAAGAAAWFAYWTLLPLVYAPRDPVPIRNALDVFALYRRMVGYDVYAAILPSLAPHGALVALMLVAAVACIRGRARPEAGRELAVAACVFGLGVAIAAFHAGAFAYFWLTLGLFPAVAIAIAARSALQVVAHPRARAWTLAGAWVAMVALAVPTVADTLRDTQAIQRASLGFAEERLAPAARGFQPDGALLCRRDPDPLPVYMMEHVVRRFGGPRAQRNADWLIEEFRSRPVVFLVGSQPLVQLPFPERVRRFWAEHYLPYAGTLMLPGRHFKGAAGDRVAFDLVAAGRYRWLENDAVGPALTIDGRRLPDEALVELEAGAHTAEFLRDVSGGQLVYFVDAPPNPDWRLAFYSPAQLSEIAGK